MINFIVEAVFIQKEHLIRVSDGIVTPQNTLVSSNASPVRFLFARRKCLWYSISKDFKHGVLMDNTIDLGIASIQQQLRAFVISNVEKEFVGFVRLRNGKTFLIGDNSVGLNISFTDMMFVENKMNVFFSGMTTTDAISSDFGIADFFVGRDFNDDFNIDFG